MMVVKNFVLLVRSEVSEGGRMTSAAGVGPSRASRLAEIE